MFKLICLFVVFAVVAALPTAIEEAPHHEFGIVKRETVDAPTKITENNEAEPFAEDAVGTQDDMDKAETFGFGYRKIIHVYPSYYGGYYPRYYYGGYYPRYHYGHYGHYW